MNISPMVCCGVPLPAEPILILPGFALAYAMNAGTLCAGTAGFTSMTAGP